jgi:pyruvate, orthophosphate dikinase
LIFHSDICSLIFQELWTPSDSYPSSPGNVLTTMGKTVGYKIGTMIEIPKAALVADEVSKD